MAKSSTRDPILNIIMGVSIIVIAIGVVGIFNMNNSIIRMDGRMKNVEYRLVSIENHHKNPFLTGDR